MKFQNSKLTILITLFFIAAFQFKSIAQTPFTENPIGHIFFLSTPDYMTKAIGINDAASVQYQSTIKDAYTYVIEDSKADLELINTKFPTIKDFYDYFIDDFLKDEKNRKIDTPKSFKNGETNYMQFDASYYSKDAKTDIYYSVTIVETTKYFYKVLSFTSLGNKAAVKADFDKIGASLHE